MAIYYYYSRKKHSSFKETNRNIYIFKQKGEALSQPERMSVDRLYSIKCCFFARENFTINVTWGRIWRKVGRFFTKCITTYWQQEQNLEMPTTQQIFFKKKCKLLMTWWEDTMTFFDAYWLCQFLHPHNSWIS